MSYSASVPFEVGSIASPQDASPLATSTLLGHSAASLQLSAGPAEVKAIAFVDASLADYQTLTAGLAPDTAVYLLNPVGNELSQISQVLSGYSHLSAVQIFSHGSNGALQLGNTSLTSDNLLDYAGVLQSWAGSLSADADLLFYGCNLAADVTGQSFVTQLAALTRADVAASTNLTGSSALGGDWNLEFSTGSIEATESLSDWAQAAYQSVLATYMVTTTNDIVDAGDGVLALREAIDQANANVGVADTINFSVSGTITLSSQLVLTDSAKTTINGGNAITVSGNNATRVFRVDSGADATLDGLTISGGSAGFGGGIENIGTLTVSNSTLTGNSADLSGGGISNSGTLIVSNSTLSGNSANNFSGGINNFGGTVTVSNSTLSGNSAGSGGGIFNFNGGTMTVSNSTLSGNSANLSGGILNDGTMTITNSTLSGNSANLGGGIFNRATMTVSNSTLSGNSANDFGAGIRNNGPLTVSNSIIAGNTAPNGREIYSFTSVTSGGYNLFGFNNDPGLVGVTTSTGDITPTVALSAILDTTLRNNGGPTQTLALVAGSPAIDTGNTTLTTDQRGTARPQGAADDIGAFEFVTPNSPPVARNDSFATNEDTVLSGNLITNTNPNGADSDPDGNPLTVATVNGTAISGATTVTLTNGSLTINPDGSFTYTPNPNANGSDSFTYTLSDGTTASDTATVSLTITPVNDAPVLTVPASVRVQSGTSSISGISISDVDAGSGLLTTTLTVSSGTLNFNNLSGATVSSGALNSSSVTLQGTLSQLNDALSTLRYNSGSSTVNATLNISVNDNGNTGGGALTDSETIALRVAEDVGTLSSGISVTRTGSVSSTDPIDRYQFTLATPTNAFFLSLSGLTANADVFILNSSGTVLRSSTNGGLTAETIFGLSLSAGTYFIEVRRVSGSTNYNLLFRR